MLSCCSSNINASGCDGEDEEEEEKRGRENGGFDQGYLMIVDYPDIPSSYRICFDGTDSWYACDTLASMCALPAGILPQQEGRILMNGSVGCCEEPEQY